MGLSEIVGFFWDYVERSGFDNEFLSENLDYFIEKEGNIMVGLIGSEAEISLVADDIFDTEPLASVTSLFMKKMQELSELLGDEGKNVWRFMCMGFVMHI